jgi:hypothetical protein
LPRRVLLALTCAAAFATTASAATYQRGDRVSASPTQMDGFWQTCVVVQGPEGANKVYQLNCSKDPRDTASLMAVPEKWMRPAAPASVPAAQGSISGSASRSGPSGGPSPAPRPVPPASGAAGAVAPGSYECWAFNSPRLTLNFTVTGPGTYRASDGSNGSFTFDAGSGRVTFTGYLAEALPAGFSAVYHEPKRRPTVSFRGRSGSEASFCERAK